MTNPYFDYGPTSSKPPTSKNPFFDDPAEEEEVEEEKGYFGIDAIGKFGAEAQASTRRNVKYFYNLLKAATPSQDPNAVATRTALREAYKMADETGKQQAGNDIKKMFEKDSFVGSVKKAGAEVKDFFTNPEREVPVTAGNTIGLLGVIPRLGIDMATSIASSTFRSISGTKAGEGGEVVALDPTEYAKASKELIGNALATIIAPGVSKAVEASFLAKQAGIVGSPFYKGSTGIIKELETAGTGAVIGVKNAAPKLGLMGRSILDDVTGAAVSGIAQGAVASANEEGVFEAMFMGLAFAPLGIATGYVRGLSGLKSGELRGPERVSAEARAVLFTRQARNLKSLNDMKHLTGATLQSDNILQALIVNGINKDPTGFVLLRNVTRSDFIALESLSTPFTNLIYHPSTKSVMAYDGVTSSVIPEDRGEFHITGRLPRRLDVRVDRTDMQGKLKGIFLKNPEAVELMNNQSIAAAQTGQPLKVIGLRQERGQHIPNTPIFYALSGDHAASYTNGVSGWHARKFPDAAKFAPKPGVIRKGPGGAKNSLIVRQLEYKNPLVTGQGGKHKAFVYQILDENQLYPYQRGYTKQLKIYEERMKLHNFDLKYPSTRQEPLPTKPEMPPPEVLASKYRNKKYEEDMEAYRAAKEQANMKYEDALAKYESEQMSMSENYGEMGPDDYPETQLSAPIRAADPPKPVFVPEDSTPTLLLTPEEASALKDAARITYDISPNSKTHPETGYQLMDKILFKAARRQGHDALVFSDNWQGIEGTEVADLLVNGIPESVGIVKSVREMVSYWGKDYELLQENNLFGVTNIRDPVTGRIIKDVSLRDMRHTDVAHQVLEVDSYYDNLFKAYELQLENTFDYEKAFASFLNEHKFVEFPDQLQREFNKRLHDKMLKEIDPLEREAINKLYSRMDAELKVKEFTQEEEMFELISELDSNGMFVRQRGSSYEVRSQDNFDSLFTGDTIEEVRAFIAQSGQLEGRALDTGSPYPTAAIPGSGIKPPVAMSQEDLNGLGLNKFSKWVAKVDASLPGMTAFPHYLNGIDTLFKTNVQGVFKEIAQPAYNRANKLISEIQGTKEIIALRKMIDDKKLVRPEMRKHLTGWIETMSAEQIAAPGGIAKQHTLSPNARAFGKWMADNDIDPHKVLMYRRTRDMLEERFDNIAIDRANKEMLIMKKGLPENTTKAQEDEMFGNLRRKIEVEVRATKEYKAQLQIVEEILGSDVNLRTAVEGFDGMHAQFGVSKAGDIYGATRYTDALRDKERFGLTRAEYATKHGLSATEIAAAEAIERRFQKFATEFGIPEYRQLNQYVNHYRQYGDIESTAGIQKFSNSIDTEGVREFVSNMIRTGEVVNYQNDPMQAMQSYIRTYVKSKELYPALDAAHKQILVEQARIEISDPKLAAELGRNWNDIAAIMSGRETMSQAAAVAVKRKYYQDLGLEPEDVAGLAASTNSLDTAISLTNASLMGGRLVMSIRDMNDAVMRKFIMHGGHRTARFLAQDVLSEKSLIYLKEHGIITEADYASMYNANLINKTPSSQITAGSRFAAEWGYKLSGQQAVNVRVQAAAYLEAREFALPIMQDIVNGKLTKAEGYKKLGMHFQEEYVKKSVDSKLSTLSEAGNIDVEGALKTYAMAEKDRLGGQYGLGVAPVGSGTIGGRLFGQMGTWSIQNRSVLMKLLTKAADREEFARIGARYMVSQGAVYGVGKMLGLNLSSWILTPASVIFTGGPLVQVAQDAFGAMKAEAGGSEVQKEYTRRQLKRDAWMILPGGGFIRDIGNAKELMTEGEGYGVLRPAAQALGIGVIKDRDYRSGMDMLTGNYPFMNR